VGEGSRGVEGEEEEEGSELKSLEEGFRRREERLPRVRGGGFVGGG